MSTLTDFIDGEGGRLGRKLGAEVEAFIDRLLKTTERNLDATHQLIDDLKEELEQANAALEGARAKIDDLNDGAPLMAAETLAEWARGEDPAKVARVLEAIRGGHVSDLSLIF
ncbi:MAG: hypothetical protein Q8S09_00350 [Hyphomonas sp.]|nr:hypothetical protein [Hyphomonas sp.]